MPASLITRRLCKELLSSSTLIHPGNVVEGLLLVVPKYFTIPTLAQLPCSPVRLLMAESHALAFFVVFVLFCTHNITRLVMSQFVV